MKPFKGNLITLMAKVNYTFVCLLFLVVGVAGAYYTYQDGNYLLVALAGFFILLGLVGCFFAPKVYIGRYILIDAQGFTMVAGGNVLWHVTWPEVGNAQCVVAARYRIRRVAGVPIPTHRMQASIEIYPAEPLEQFMARHPEMTESLRGDCYRIPATAFSPKAISHLHQALCYFSGGKSPGVVESAIATGGQYEF